jgi:hypothetical protein
MLPAHTGFRSYSSYRMSDSENIFLIPGSLRKPGQLNVMSCHKETKLTFKSKSSLNIIWSVKCLKTWLLGHC